MAFGWGNFSVEGMVFGCNVLVGDSGEVKKNALAGPRVNHSAKVLDLGVINALLQADKSRFGNPEIIRSRPPFEGGS
ncbi:hypothetical protein DSO57_1038247 [Entomophthora muscae]|uniref:Uncharacterized protein n=1 Tax=Entomophthora muscae TaxID=34485 RepID=A0ACC2SMR8_9FUNG|nr:hypothetical protein DSO57_1038247 [Entomophthora muscae]